MELIKQEVSAERFIPIPEPVRDAYRIYRPSPLVRALGLERSLDTPARIYYKYEGGSPAGSHKPNTAIAQAFYNREEGVRRLVTETGAGQWGARSPSPARCSAWRPRSSWSRSPLRAEAVPAQLHPDHGRASTPSPSEETNAGRAILAEDPDSTGSLGIAISEALEVAATNEDTKYSLGSVLNHVLLHQTVIGQEVAKQLEMAGETADVVIGCAGGGSNFAGIAFPLLRDRLNGSSRTRFLAVEPASCPSLTRASTATTSATRPAWPMVKMHTLGHQFRPAPIHAGGLRYHGMAPLVSHLYELGFLEARAYARTRASRRPSSSPGPRASSRRRSRRTPSGRRSTRPSPPARTARSG